MSTLYVLRFQCVHQLFTGLSITESRLVDWESLAKLHVWRVSCEFGFEFEFELNVNSNLNSNTIRYSFIDTWYTLFNSFRPSDHICVTKLTIIGSDNGLSPGRRRPIIWTNAGILLDPMKKIQWHFNRNWNSSLKKMHLKMSSEKCGHFASASMCEIVTCLWQSYDMISYSHMRATLPCV